MSSVIKLSLLLSFTALLVSAGTISFSGPTTLAGVACNVGDPGCVNGTAYVVYGVQLTQPTASNSNWVLTIEMNFPDCPAASPGCNTQGNVATPGNTLPNHLWSDGLLYSAADFLINWNGKDYGILLAQHIQGGNSVDSYVAGDLYQAPNSSPDLITAIQVLNSGGSNGPFRPNQPVWLAPGGNLLGAGNISIIAGGNGTPAAYTITDQFSAPAGFLSDGHSFTITADSYVCANGIIVGTTSFTGPSSGTPEPGTFLLALPGLLALGWRRARRGLSSGHPVQ